MQIKRFHMLLTVKDTAMDIPANLEARRRISFFATSLFMDMPSAPKVRNMLAFRCYIFFCLEYYFLGKLNHLQLFHPYLNFFLTYLSIVPEALIST